MSALKRVWTWIGLKFGFFLVEEARTEHRLYYDPAARITELEAALRAIVALESPDDYDTTSIEAVRIAREALKAEGGDE